MPISLEDFAAFVADNPLGVVSTNDRERGPQAALVSFAATDDGAVLFNAREDSRKIANLAQDSRVALVIGCSGSVSIQLEGLAALPSAAERAEWGALHQRRFPGSRALAPGFTVVRVQPSWLRIYDVSTASPIIREGTPAWASLPEPDRAEPDPKWRCQRDRPVPDDVARLLATVPEWFGLPEANADYVEAARVMETWTVRDDSGQIVGVTLVDRHFPHVAELHLTVVDRAHHGQGVGSAMLGAIESDARQAGVRMLEVKTLGASHPDPGYARTRHFYYKQGFWSLEETDLWGEQNPCLIMVKTLIGGAAR